MSINFQNLHSFFNNQLNKWKLASDNYANMSLIERKHIDIDGIQLVVQYNPGRIISSTASISPKTILNRPCFLCSNNLPKDQNKFPINDNFNLLVNPYPIFNPHFTIPHKEHISQQIFPYFTDMLEITEKMDGFSIFFNGAKSGASAPDHLHFQACIQGVLPIEHEWVKMKENVEKQDKYWQYFKNDFWSFFVIQSKNKKQVIDSFFNIMTRFFDENIESMLNIITTLKDDNYQIIIFPRKKHRPEQYFYDNEKKLMISPGTVDMGGLFVAPRKEDFDKITANDILSIYQQVSLFLS